MLVNPEKPLKGFDFAGAVVVDAAVGAAIAAGFAADGCKDRRPTFTMLCCMGVGAHDHVGARARAMCCVCVCVCVLARACRSRACRRAGRYTA